MRHGSGVGDSSVAIFYGLSSSPIIYDLFAFLILYTFKLVYVSSLSYISIMCTSHSIDGLGCVPVLASLAPVLLLSYLNPTLRRCVLYE